MPLDDGGGFEKGNDAMQDKFKGKGAPLVQAAAVAASENLGVSLTITAQRNPVEKAWA